MASVATGSGRAIPCLEKVGSRRLASGQHARPAKLAVHQPPASATLHAKPTLGYDTTTNRL